MDLLESGFNGESLVIDVINELGEDVGRVEMRPSEVSRRLRMRPVIVFHGNKRLLGLLSGRECTRPHSGRNKLGKSGILDNYRASGSEVTSRSAAKPTAAERDINVLRY